MLYKAFMSVWFVAFGLVLMLATFQLGAMLIAEPRGLAVLVGFTLACFSAAPLVFAIRVTQKIWG